MSSYKLTNSTPIPQSILDVIQDEKYSDQHSIIAGVVSNTRLSWFACGPYLAIVDTKTGNKVAQWTFGAVLKDTSTKIVCVQELKSSYKEVSLLVVGLESLTTGGMICIFDIFAWKVLRAVQFRDKITSVHVISNGNESTSFPGPISNFDGALAVGTIGGDVFIVDLCRQAIDEACQGPDSLDIKNEIDPCQMTVISVNSIDRIERYKEVAETVNNHLAICINELIEPTPHFVLKGPKGDDRIHVNKQEVCVSSLHYAPQLCSLIVGYNFGALQIWNLLNMGLSYTSPVHDENMPIASFAMQEPVDDPRAFCYFWAVYSNTEVYQKSFPIAVLYALSYESKDWHEGYGYIYRNLQSCAIRFQADLSIMSSKQGHKIPVGAHCLRLHPFTKGASKDVSNSSSLESHESYMLCLMVWNVWCKDRATHTYLSVFDLNQWYKDQMPTVPQSSNLHTFMTHVCLSDVISDDSQDKKPVLDAQINPASIVQFMGAQRLEEHYYPNSLAFDCVTISEAKLSHIKCYGSQRQLFRDLEAAGPLALMKPTEFYEKSVQLGLTPLFMESLSANSATLIHQRELLLSVALEHRMKNWLCKCAMSWGNGSHRAAGLSLELLLNWAWQRTNVLKSNVDKLCVSLFDYSEIKLDFNADLMFRKCRSHIEVIKELYSFVCKKCSSFLIHQDVTQKQYECVQRILIYLNVLEWMINVGLLPECPLSMYTTEPEKDKISVPYPINVLADFYKERRNKLLNQDTEKKIFNGSPILYIDKIIQLSGGNLIESEWKQDGGSGKYPPSSVQGLVRTYLLENVDLQYKHTIVTYFLLDMAMNLDQDRYKSIIPTFMKFPSIFQLSPSMIKVIQAFWLLDHGDLGTAAEQLIDPMIKAADLCDWHHTFILKNLLLRDHQKLALLYLKVRQTPLLNSKEISIAIALLISNNMLYEALALTRKHSGKEGDQLLEIIFEECYKQKQLNDLVSITLSRTEEEALLKYLKAIRFNDEDNFKCVYYLQRTRYFNFYNQSHAASTNEDIDITRDIKEVMRDIVPNVTRRLTNTCKKDNVNVLQKANAFTPMSVFLHNKKENSTYKSDFLGACLKKSHDIWLDPYNNGTVKSAAEITDDDFPFSRPPHALCYKPKANVDIIYPNVVKSFTRAREDDEEDVNPIPSKRLKLSPRDAGTPKDDRAKLRELTKIETPVIRRKHCGQKLSANVPSFNIATPQSILKVRNLVSSLNATDFYRGDSTTPENLDDVDDDSSSSSKKDSVYRAATRKYGVSARKSIVRTPVVRFTDVKSLTSAESSATNTPIVRSSDSSLIINPLPEIPDIGSKNSSLSTSNETYYSPEVSLELENASGEDDDQKELKTQTTDIPHITIDETSSDSNQNGDGNFRATPSPDLISTKQADERSRSLSISPKPRKSYKEELQADTSLRSSPRLRKRAASIDTQETTPVDKPTSRPSTRLLGRRSLSRQVLENNASKALTSSDLQPTNTPSSVVIEKITRKQVVKTITGKVIEQTVDKYESSNVIKKSIEAGVENVTRQSHEESTTSKRRVVEEESQDDGLKLDDESEGECMDVDDEVNLVSEINNDKLVKETDCIAAPSIPQSKSKDTAESKQTESPTKNEQNPDEEEVDIYEDLSSSSNANYAIFDPQMNVFQMHGDLTYNDNTSMDAVPKGNSELDVTNYADYQAEQEEFEKFTTTMNPELKEDENLCTSRNNSEQGSLNAGICIEISDEDSKETGSSNSQGSRKPDDVISLGSSEKSARDDYDNEERFSFNDDESDDAQAKLDYGMLGDYNDSNSNQISDNGNKDDNMQIDDENQIEGVNNQETEVINAPITTDISNQNLVNEHIKDTSVHKTNDDQTCQINVEDNIKSTSEIDSDIKRQDISRQKVINVDQKSNEKLNDEIPKIRDITINKIDAENKNIEGVSILKSDDQQIREFITSKEEGIEDGSILQRGSGNHQIEYTISGRIDDSMCKIHEGTQEITDNKKTSDEIQKMIDGKNKIKTIGLMENNKSVVQKTDCDASEKIDSNAENTNLVDVNLKIYNSTNQNLDNKPLGDKATVKDASNNKKSNDEANKNSITVKKGTKEHIIITDMEKGKPITKDDDKSKTDVGDQEITQDNIKETDESVKKLEEEAENSMELSVEMTLNISESDDGKNDESEDQSLGTTVCIDDLISTSKNNLLHKDESSNGSMQADEDQDGKIAHGCTDFLTITLQSDNLEQEESMLVKYDDLTDNTISLPSSPATTNSPARVTRSASVRSAQLSTPVKNLRRSLRAGSVDSPPRALRSRRSSTSTDSFGLSEQPKGTPKRRSSIKSEDSQSGGTPNRRSSIKSEEPEVTEKPKAAKRTRAASVEHEAPVTPQRRMRTKSVDTAVAMPAEKVVAKGRGRRVSAVLPIISEEPKKARPDIIETYTTSRRLTRRQAELLERNLDPSSAGVNVSDVKTNSMDVEEDEKAVLDIQSMDPIQLLNKDEFRGDTDPDEEGLLQRSPVSSIASSSAAEVLRSKRASSSEKMETHTDSTTNKRKNSTTGSTTARRGRSKSIDVIEETDSPQPSAPRRVTRKSSQESETEPRRSGRCRTNSEKSVDSDTDSKTSGRGRKKQAVLAKSELSKITEETTQDVEQVKPKKGRPQKLK